VKNRDDGKKRLYLKQLNNNCCKSVIVGY